MHNVKMYNIPIDTGDFYVIFHCQRGLPEGSLQEAIPVSQITVMFISSQYLTHCVARDVTSTGCY